MVALAKNGVCILVFLIQVYFNIKGRHFSPKIDEVDFLNKLKSSRLDLDSEQVYIWLIPSSKTFLVSLFPTFG